MLGEKRDMYHSKNYYITPEEYEIAQSNGISERTLNTRVRQLGWDKERAITTPVQQKKDRSKWKAIAESNGISIKTFLSRVNSHGWDEKKAATQPMSNGSKRNRKYSKEIDEVLIKNGISKNTFYTRIKRGWTIERASTEKVYTEEEKLRKMWNSKRIKEK